MLPAMATGKPCFVLEAHWDFLGGSVLIAAAVVAVASCALSGIAS